MGKHKTRNQEWLNRQIDRLLSLGDRRTRKELVQEITSVGAVIRAEITLAEDTAHRESETVNGEVIVHRGHNYPFATLYEGELLHRGNAYVHPVLARA
jgi:hypothetical protein